MQGKRLVAICAAWVLVESAHAFQQRPQFTASEDICVIDLSYVDFARVLGRVREYIIAANKDHDVHAALVIDQVTLGDGRASLRVVDDFGVAALSKGPALATEVRYFYNLDARDGAPVSQVTISLGDEWREVEVIGRSQPQVEGLVSLVLRDVQPHCATFGGESQRFAFGLALLWVAVVVVGSGMQAPTQTVRAVVVRLVVALSIAVVVVALPWDAWFPGSVVRVDDPSFLVRWGPVIGFVGTVVGVVGLLLPFWQARRRSARGIAPRPVSDGDGVEPPGGVPP